MPVFRWVQRQRRGDQSYFQRRPGCCKMIDLIRRLPHPLKLQHRAPTNRRITGASSASEMGKAKSEVAIFIPDLDRECLDVIKLKGNPAAYRSLYKGAIFEMKDTETIRWLIDRLESPGNHCAHSDRKTAGALLPFKKGTFWSLPLGVSELTATLRFFSMPN